MRHKWDPICPSPRGLVRPVRLEPNGVTGPTPGQAKGAAWRRTSHGFYVPSAVPTDVPEQRILEQSARLPDGGAVTGWAALRLHGGNFFDGLAPDGATELPVPLAVGPRSKMRGDSRVTLSREPLPVDETTVRHGLPGTAAARALFDEMRRKPGDVRAAGEVLPPEVSAAVIAMATAAAALLVSIRQLRESHEPHRSWRRARTVELALRLASERSRSPQESRSRMIWEIDAGLGRPLVIQRVWDLEGNLLGVADLLDPEVGLVGEFDGADHRKALRHTQDIARQERFERHGLEVLRITGLDLLDPSKVVDRIHFHRSRAVGLATRERRWTIQPPPGSVPEQSLDKYLAERDFHNRLHQDYEQQATFAGAHWS